MSGQTIFITGASGFIGSALVKLATAQGYHVRGLSRSETSDKTIRQNGGIPVRGDLTSSEVLTEEASKADIVCFLASAFTGLSEVTYEESMHLNMRAVNTLGAAMADSNKPLVVSSTAMITKANLDGQETTEDSPDDPNPFYDHATPSENALKWASRGVRVSIIRLGILVYGPGDVLTRMLQGLVAACGAVPIVDGGQARTSTVHVNDAARLYLLAAEKSGHAQCYNAVAETANTLGEILGAAAEVIGAPTKHLTFTEATTQIGPMLATYLSSPCRGSSEKARRVLDWKPEEIGIIEYYKSLKLLSEPSRAGAKQSHTPQS